MDRQRKIAVLIDAENVSKKYIKLILDEVSDFGTPTYKRVYGDFSNPSVLAWKEELTKYALSPVFQFSYTKGKNAADSAMIIDAMDILYSGNVNGFCLVTSDSDFTKLANRLREAGMLVVGMGEQKTPSSLVTACEQFKFLDLLSQDEKMEAGGSTHLAGQKEGLDSGGILSKDELGQEITSIINLKSDEKGWINQSEIGVMLSKRVPGFDPRNYGYPKLKGLIESFPFLETDIAPNPKNSKLTIVYVRIK